MHKAMSELAVGMGIGTLPGAATGTRELKTAIVPLLGVNLVNCGRTWQRI